MIEKKTLNTLEFDKILAQLAGFAASDYAAGKIKETVPAASLSLARTLISETAEADKVLYEYSKAPMLAVDDVSEALALSTRFSVLTIPDLLKIGRLLKVSRNLNSLEGLPAIPLLKEKVRCLYSDKSLEDGIYDAFPTDTDVSDNASAELKFIRNRIRKTNDSIKAKLNSFVTGAMYSKYLQDGLVTIRGDRYVIPVKAEYKGAVPGLIHDQSSSGATLFVEPMAVVEMNNELKTLLLEEKAEIDKILRRFTAEIAAVASELTLNLEVITDLDVIFSRAMLARKMHATMPVLNDTGYISIDSGRHPLIDAKKVVPVSIRVGRGFDILLITGPNTGGKTVTLKLCGLFTVMALSGLFIPARNAELSIFDGIFCDIGDEQSIEQNLSTFSSHMKNIINIVEKLTRNSLLLFDELGAGTDPAEGAALAVAITDYVLSSGAKAVITTHFNDLKEFSVRTDRVENASMDFDIDTFAPTYHLIMGSIGASNALQIAKRLGLKTEITEKALSLISNEKKDFENVLLSAETTRKRAEILVDEAKADRDEAARLLSEIKSERNYLKEQREKLNENVRKETKRLIESSVYEAEEVIEEIRSVLAKGDELEESDLFQVRKLKKRLENFAASYDEDEVLDIKEDPSPLNKGDTVFVKTINQTGILKSITPKGAEVRVGNVVMQVKQGDFCKIKPQKGGALKGRKTVSANISASIAQTAKSELMLIGMNREEAIENVNNFLASASLAGLSEVRIVHGKGMGVLRAAVQKHLVDNPYAAEFRDGGYYEGERGVTIVKIK
ncbi:MAG: endonuclease MutS2 [Clostridiaceae bacterium]|jgi:DNA mismatch repair protein MutS2|nr:endonuclease MutS2 [Clostridiaceae bacterium]